MLVVQEILLSIEYMILTLQLLLLLQSKDGMIMNKQVMNLGMKDRLIDLL